MMCVNQDEDRMLTETEVTAMISISPSSLRRWVAKSSFPAPVTLEGSRYKRWLMSDVQQWIQSKRNTST
ncbi:helix-turn-helix transcriptional regulator [Oceanicoccus sagamiensis]|uniref:Helix-turn-helix domain-containing protein n=1 Tax=Oceanicoccus sagamiensis TaxID=716816 RepID=A0A1X9N8H9_9GAMM|nr:AlpA family phage regulatory protein [Oceanicoccus sagamiensis]ARN72742.1 hypothetical protein BST96_00600 [Oceanicoccus sagamiensis]